MRFFFFFVAALTVLLSTARATAAYAPPARAGFVTDPGNQLAPDAAKKISGKLAAYRECSTNEIAVFLPTSLEGNTIEDVAYVTFNTWKLGLAAKDNGVLLVVAANERKAFIATGKGVGGEIPDITAFHILRDHVTPNMKAGNVVAAVDQGTSAIGKELGGCAMAAPTASPAGMSTESKGVARFLFGIGVIVCAFGLFTGLRRGKLLSLLLAGIVTAIFEAGTYRWDPIAFGMLFSIPLYIVMFLVWVRRNPKGIGGTASSASYESGGSSGGGYSSGGSTGGGGAGDSW